MPQPGKGGGAGMTTTDERGMTSSPICIGTVPAELLTTATPA